MIKMWKDLWNKIKATLIKILNVFENKRIKIKFKDKDSKFYCISIIFDSTFVPHSLAIDSIPYFKKMNFKWRIINAIKKF